MIKLFTFVVAVFTITTLVQAQSNTAVLSEAFVLQLDPEQPIAAEYVINCSDMEFTSDEAAQRFFNSIQDNLVEYTYDVATQTATLTLALPLVADRGWGVPEWNNYFSTTAERYSRMFEAFN